jgi:acyl carrier protein
MAGPATTDIEIGVIEAVKQVSRRPVEPALESHLVADLGFDSLEVLELVAELEARFDISVPVDDVPSARTVAQVIAHVARLVGERTPRA